MTADPWRPPHRVVRITKDPQSILWFLSCADDGAACKAAGGGRSCRTCWLGSAKTAEAARAYADRLGYTVVE